MLPGNAVEHLHAVAGEWQLLADLSFADYLMWVHRDDGALVCVAQVRPNTAPTVLLADAVGTLEDDDHVPLVTAAFESGTIGRENIGGQEDSAGLKVEAVPVRYNNEVVAVLTHQTALAAARKASPLESAYLDCAGDLLLMLSDGTFPNVGDLAMSRSSPRVGDGFIRLNEVGDVTFASPNAISAYHRMGLTAELEGHNLVAVTRPLIGDPFEAQELANHVRDSLAGRVEHAHGGRRRGRGRRCARCHWWCTARPLAPRCRSGCHRGRAATARCCPRTRPSARSTTVRRTPADRRRTLLLLVAAHEQR
jgi:hypothetical protein